MGRRGPKPKPTALKKLQGNPGKRKLNESEPQFTGIPTPPDFLGPEALAEWNRLGPELAHLGLLKNADRAAFAAYCEAYGDFQKYTREIKDTGETFTTDKGYVGIHPFVALRNKALEKLRQYAAEFGLTPAARSKVTVPETDENPEEKKAELFLFKGGKPPSAPAA